MGKFTESFAAFTDSHPDGRNSFTLEEHGKNIKSSSFHVAYQATQTSRSQNTATLDTGGSLELIGGDGLKK
jgi:hypothetical protein